MEDRFYYAVNTHPNLKDGHWSVLKGWLGCRAGHGDMLAENLTSTEVDSLMNELYPLWPDFLPSLNNNNTQSP